MNIKPKTVFALGAAGFSLITLASQAGAQATVGDPTLTPVFSTYNGKGVPNSTTGAIGLGFDSNSTKLPGSTTQATAQSIYIPFNLTSSAAGTFSTIAAGSTLQLSSYINNQNVNLTAGINNNFDVYVSLYAYNPSAAVGTVPVMGSNLFGSEQKIIAGPNNGSYFSADFTNTVAIVAGQSYVFGFTTLNNDTQDYALMDSVVAAQTGLSASGFALAQNKYITTDDDQGAPTLASADQNNPTTLAFSLSAAAAPAAVPEASSLVSTALLLTLGGAFFAFKRRSVAK